MSGNPVQSLERARAILEILCRREQPTGVTEFASRLQLAKSTVHRLLSTLEQSGFVTRTTEAKYRLGLKLWELGCAAVRGLNVRDAARPFMEELMSSTGETVHLSIWDHAEVVYIDKVDSPNPIRLHSMLGGRAPAHAVASGLAFLAFQDESTQADICKRGLRRFTERTITSPGRLRGRLEEIRRDGYAASVGAWHHGSAGVAAPIRSHLGSVVAAVSVAGPAERIVGRVPELASLVRATAESISHVLGHPTARRRPSMRIVRQRTA